MGLFGFEKETLLDLTVNAIPLGILLFFIAAFAVVSPFGLDPVFSGLQFSLMISMFLLLAVLTYYAGRAVEDAEQAEEAAEIAESDAKAESLEDGTETTDDEAEPEGDDELPEA
ncbi:DUF6684 family protein [Halomicroarcula sp. GCM10025894]|uniref:DUF6684 family protein n=1 Tax=Haloarcula TaxID=2237 RepID=UPI0023E75E49|nr:DUF6684 family protein [Halomicroarcula sp. SHR3]